MRKVLLYILTVSLVSGLLFSCINVESFPDEPAISFNSVPAQDEQMLTIKVDFTDGDGNFGLDQEDLDESPFDQAPFNKNLIVDYYELQNGEWQRFGPDFPSFSPFFLPTDFDQAIPRAEPTGQNQTQKGFFEYDVAAPYYDITSPFDTFMYVFYIYDRDLNQSNIDSTSMLFKPN